jgi:polysaccharide biosynthesis/export protein
MTGLGRRLSLLGIAASGILILAGMGRAAAADQPYRLTPGDTVEIALSGLPEQRQRTVIQLDGTIALPAVGSVTVAGLTSTELQSKMEALLPTKVFRHRGPDGREQVFVVKPGDVTAWIAEYRPIYVTGDVLTPGQQAFRPQMTVRQAITVAGGYSLLRSRATQAGPDPIDLRRDHDSLWTDFLREHFHALRVRAEMDDQETFDQKPPRNAPLSPQVAASIAQAEAESLRIAISDYRLERSFLERAVKESDEQIVVLTQREQEEEKGVQSDTQELERVNRLFGSGSLVSPRVTESRRALLLSSSRRLETTVQLMRTKRQLDEFGRQLERLANQRRINLLRELRDSNVRLADLGVRIQAVGERLRPLGNVSSMAAGENLRSEVAIVRKNGQQWRRLSAGEDTEVEPGDVLEVTFRGEATTAPVVQ